MSQSKEKNEKNMNTGQMLITMAAMALLSSVILNVNKRNLTTSKEMSETKYKIMAVSYANTLIEEAFSKSFDEATTDNNMITSKQQLSTILKADAGEYKRSKFDDFDDYNNFSDSTNSDPNYNNTPMSIRAIVRYVDPAASLDSVGYKTWNKRITVTVTSPFINEGKDKITLSKINSHYYFR